MITNYTKVVFKDRLEVILGAANKEEINNELEEKEIEKYKNIIIEHMAGNLIYD